MRVGESHIHTAIINSLPDDVLLEIFGFYQKTQDLYGFHPVWLRLAHICSRWRRIIFSSPHRLNLQLLCTYGTPVKKNLGHWPPIPLIIDYTDTSADDSKRLTPCDEENVVAALENSARVRYVSIYVTSSLLGKIATAMQNPFPALTHLWLSSKDGHVSTFPNKFLGGSASALRAAYLEGIQIPALPKLLSSALGLVELRLLDIPHDDYISPETMVTSLAALTRLKTLVIEFKSPTPLSETRRQDHKMRTGFPSLTTFGFHGVKEYLEDLVDQIDTPQLDHLSISCFNQLDFQVPRLSEFLARAHNLYMARFTCARVEFDVSNVHVRLYERDKLPESHFKFSLRISCRGLDWQVSHVAQILNQCSAILSNVGGLSIDARDLPPDGKDYKDAMDWLELLRPFTAVETLHVSGKSASHVAHGLEYVTEEMVPVVLPALHSLCLQDEPLTSVERFVEARWLTGRAITIADAPAAFFERLESLWSWKEYLSN